ncbi:MAG: sodium-dependent bicarbonate transport family permease [Minwuia sp.]|uniref:sodium-dependent bicarbonate transport family permease n=1 Tax=Minwuia sp. TaxID=2493630 RepID=UPI003A876E95
MIDLALGNLLSPMVLFFALGMAAGLARSDLAVPEVLAKGMALYLMLAIGLKGGVALAETGLNVDVIAKLMLGAALSFAIPFLAFALLRATSRMPATDAGSVAAHYGSISVVTFVAAGTFLTEIGVDYGGSMVAVVAIMETPAIVAGLFLAHRYSRSADAGKPEVGGQLVREILLNGSIVLLMGSFFIGWITGPAGMEAVAPFIAEPFKGVLCLFLLDMGLVAARRLREAGNIGWGSYAFAVYMPVISACIGAGCAALFGFSVGDVMLFGLLSASASYIAVPAAMRMALPEANPSISLSLSLGITFPFNLAVGIPLYLGMARWLTGG